MTLVYSSYTVAVIKNKYYSRENFICFQKTAHIFLATVIFSKNWENGP